MPDLDDSGASGTDSGQGAGEANQGEQTGGQSATGAEGNSGSGEQSQRDSELESLRNRMRAADQRASKAELELKQVRDKDLPEAEKLKRDYAAAQEANAKLEADLKAARIQNAFLSDNTHTWHNPTSALKLVDLSRLEIDGEGAVHGLKDALNQLAKEHPYLVKPKQDKDEKGSGENASGGLPGTPPMNGPGSRTGTDKGALARRIPALRTRM